MQRLSSLHRLAKLCAQTSQQWQPAVTAETHSPALSALCRRVHLRFEATDTSGGGSASDSGSSESADASAAADAEAPAPADAEVAAAPGGGDSSGDQQAEEAEEEEDTHLDVEDGLELTDDGMVDAFSSDIRVMDRPNRKPTRAEKGSYRDNSDFAQELEDIAIKVPSHVPLYDLRTAAPGLVEPRSDALDELMTYGEEHIDQLLEEMGLNEEANPANAGLRPILRWEVRMRLDTSGQPNLVNRKVKCKVYLRELQEETGLTDAALRHIALVCGSRYNPNTGELTLVSEKYPEREENRLHVVETLQALVEEGERVYPSEQPAQEAHSS